MVIMPNQIDTRRMIPVNVDTHQELSELKTQEQLTFDEMVEKLMNFYKANS